MSSESHIFAAKAAPEFRRLLARAVVLPLALLAALAGVFLWQLHNLLDETRKIEQVEGVVTLVHRVEKLLVDKETGLRGYLVTGDKFFLAPYERSNAEMGDAFQQLDALTAYDEEQAERFARLRSDHARWEGYALEAIRLRERNENYRDRELHARYRIVMDALRDTADALHEAEVRRRDELIAEARRATLRVEVSAIAVALLLGGVLAFFARRQLLGLSLAYDRALTAQQEQAAALQRSEARFRRLFESNLLGIAFATGPQITEANDAFLQIIGYSRDDVRGGRVRWDDLSAPGYEEEHRKAAAQLEATGSCEPYEKEYLRADGSRVPVLIGYALVGGQESVGFILDISDQKRAEAALRESRAQYKHIIDQANDIIYRTDHLGRFTFVNPVATRLMQRSQEELIGLAYLDLVAPAHHEATQQFYVTQYRQRTPSTYYEFPVVAADGSEIWLGQHLQLIIENDQVIGFQAVARDITERRRAEEARRESHALLSAIVEGTTDAIFLKDVEGRYQLINSAGARLLGADGEQVIGRDDSSFFPPETAREIAELDRRVLASGEGLTYESVRNYAGARRTLFTTKTTLRDAQGRAVGVIGVSRDITERKRAEEERESLIRELQQALAEVQTLSGLLPICSYCKSIRDDQNYWQKIESYVSSRSGAQFSHSVCPDCYEQKVAPILEQYAGRERSPDTTGLA